MTSPFSSLAEVIDDALFFEVDLGLRRGRHLSQEDGAAYTFLIDAQEHLETFYRRLGAELSHRSDGFFFLVPVGDRLGRSQLSAGEMLVGQALALLYLDPASLAAGGSISRSTLLQRLTGLVGKEALVRTLTPRKRKYDERTAEETVRKRVAHALQALHDLGFVQLIDSERIRLRPALVRFADPVRAAADRQAALEQLIGRGELVAGQAAAEAPLEGDDEEGA